MDYETELTGSTMVVNKTRPSSNIGNIKDLILFQNSKGREKLKSERY